MTALMGGMFPVMAILMRHDPAAMRPDTLRFWGFMSGAIMAGAAVACPFNVWLVAHALKRGMGTASVLGRGAGGGAIAPHEPHPHVTARAIAAATAGEHGWHTSARRPALS